MKKLVIAALLMAMISGASAQSTGAAPSFQDLGEVRPGQTIKSTLYTTTTGYNQPYFVQPSVERPLASKILNREESVIPLNQYSEENITSWVDFSQEIYTITPNNETAYVLSNGRSIRASGSITYYIRVPRDAEPGFHAGAFALNPRVSIDGSGYGTQAQTLARPTFVFEVVSPQRAERRLEVVDARGIRTGEDSARVDIRIANRGTVTTTIRDSAIGVYNRDTGQRMGGISIAYESIEPQQSRVISAYFRNQELSQGNYLINGTIDYTSSQSFVGQQTFLITDQIQTDPEDPEEFNNNTGQESGGSEPSIWLMAIFVIVMSAIMYSFGFDLFWIIVAAGFIVIGLFIVISPVSNWMLLILLTTPVIILYYA